MSVQFFDKDFNDSEEQSDSVEESNECKQTPEFNLNSSKISKKVIVQTPIGQKYLYRIYRKKNRTVIRNDE